MKSKFQFSLLSALAICGALTTAGVIVGNTIQANPPKVGEAAEVTHTLLMDKNNTIKDNWVNVDNGRQIWINSSNYTAGTTNFGSITSGGSLREAGDRPLYGMKSVTVSLTSGSLIGYFGFSGESKETAINPALFPAGSASTVALEGNPCCFEFLAKADSVIDYISITYSCSYIASPTQESTNILDLGTEADSFALGGDISFARSTAHTKTSSHSLHLWTAATSHTESWPTVLIQLKNPITVSATGSILINAYFDTCDQAWMSFKLYDSSWNQVGAEHGGDYTQGAYKENWAQPGTATTIALIRIALHEKVSSVSTSVYLDDVVYVANP